jgi:hypothetical protein
MVMRHGGQLAHRHSLGHARDQSAFQNPPVRIYPDVSDVRMVAEGQRKLVAAIDTFE